MSFEEKIKNEVGMRYSKLLEENENKIVDYLNSHLKEVSIISEELDFDDLFDIKNGKKSLDDINLLTIDNNITTYNYNDKTNEIISKYISRDVEKLTAPVKLFNKCKLSEFKNLKKLSLINSPGTLNKEMLDRITREGNLEELRYPWFNISDDLKKDSIVFGDIITNLVCYKDLVIKKENLKLSKSLDIYCKEPFIQIEKILDLIEQNKTDKLTRIDIDDKIKRKLSDFVISYRLENETRYNDETKEKIKEDIGILEIEKVENINDVINVVNSFKDRGYQINSVKINLDNKNYENIHLLKKLENEYNLMIKYDGSYDEISLNDFVAMRETLNYYKELIEEENLSNFEKILYAYDIIKSFEYQEVEENENKNDSRNIHSIIRNGKIVCVGYASFYSQLLKELGIESYSISTNVPRNGKIFGHQRNIVNVVDNKYGIDGYYAFDPTWDSAHNVVKCIDANGEEKFKSTIKLEENDKVIKKYDNLVLYRHFLIPGYKYQEVFEGEELPDFNSLSIHDNNNEKTSMDDVNKDFLNSRDFDNNRLIEAIKIVRLKEGYSINNIDETIQDIIEVNKLNSMEKLDDEVTIKR